MQLPDCEFSQFGFSKSRHLTLSAFLAAGVAILLLFLDGLDNVSTRLQEDLGVFKDILDVYAKQGREAANCNFFVLWNVLSCPVLEWRLCGRIRSNSQP